MRTKKLLLTVGIVLVFSWSDILLSQSQILKPEYKVYSYGVPASPDLLKLSQPGGEPLDIYLKGDARINWYQTPDGYTVMKNLNGVLEYATLNKKGELISSGIKVRNIDSRTPAERAFLAKIPKEIRYSKKQIENLKSNTQLDTKGASKAFPRTGVNNLLVILIDYPDASYTYPASNFDSMMNENGYNSTGSFRDYYYANSYNQLTVVTTIKGWYTTSKNHDYYCRSCSGGNYPNTSRELVREAVDSAEADGVDFSAFDNDGNGSVDGVMVIHQGEGAEQGDLTNVWSHSWTLGPYSVTYDGKIINDYTINPETNGSAMGTIGVLCHEFGHNLGLRDYYDTDYGTNGQSFHLEYWDCMASGCYNNNAASPAPHNTYSKYLLTWLTGEELNASSKVTLPNAVETDKAYFYTTTTANEFFWVENRQMIPGSFDEFIPGHGMLIYHVDGNHSGWSDNTLNDDSTYNAMDIEEADCIWTSATYEGDPYPGSDNITSFTDATSPNSKSWANANTNKPITNITEKDGVITFDFMGGDPLIPVDFAATPISSDQIDVNWSTNASTDPVLLAWSSNPDFGNPVDGVSYSAGNSIPGGGTVLYSGSDTFYYHTSLSQNTEYYYMAWSYDGTTDYTSGVYDEGRTHVDSFPYIQDFDEFVAEQTNYASCIASDLYEGWTNSLTDDTDWTPREGSTPSSNTGPSGDNTSGSGKYLYTEASNCLFHTADALSTTFDLTSMDTAVVTFAYHMYGTWMGTLQIDLYYNNSWHTQMATSWDGTPPTTLPHNENNDTWKTAVSSLTDAAGYDDVIIRFRGITGAMDYRSDMAIDDIVVEAYDLCNPPTTQASAFSMDDSTTTSMDISWTRGDGDSVIIVARKGSPVLASPISGVGYTADASFGSGDEIAAGQYVVYNGSSTSTIITNLSILTQYYFAIFEYYASDNCYLTPGLIGSAETADCTPPATQASAYSMDDSTTSTMDISWTRGDGDGLIIVAREGSAVSATPASGVSYDADASFGSGDEIAAGEYVVYEGISTSTTITGLSQGTEYYFAIFEYNTTDSCYLTPALTGSGETDVIRYNITFNVDDGTNPIAGADVTLTGYGTQATNGSGQTIFAGVAPDNIDYVVAKATYDTVFNNLDVVASDMTENVSMSLTTYDVTFIVDDGTNPLPGASVTLTGYGSQSTNGSGQTVFTNVLPENDIVYTIARAGYDDVIDSLDVVASDTTIYVTMTLTTYDVTFTVIDGANPLDAANVTLASYGSQLTNASGQTVFTDVLPGTGFSYTVTKTDYQMVSSTIDVNGDELVLVILVHDSITTYNISFTVMCGTDSLTARVSLTGYGSQNTDVRGQTVFAGVAPADDIVYTVIDTGYYDLTDSLDLGASDTSIDVQITLITYDVTFVVTDGTDSVEGATVTLTGYGSQVTNTSGITVFTDVAPGTIPYTVTATGYIPYNGNVTIVDSDITENVGLLSRHSVRFTVTDGTNPIQNATVTLDEYTPGNTNSSGVTYILEVVPASDIPYTVTAAGYYDTSGTVDVVDSDVMEDAILRLITFIVTFNVDDGTNPIGSATVSLAGYTDEMTSIGGQAIYSAVIPANDILYSVTAAGYHDASGTITVTSSNVTEAVHMDIVGVQEETVHQLSLYPNPTNNWVSIRGISQGKLIVKIFDVTGVQVANYELHEKYSLDMSNFESGTYIIQFYLNDEVSYRKLILR